MIEELNPYDSYLSTEIPWVQKLPAGWKVRRAKSLFTRVNRAVRAGDEVVTCFRDGAVTIRKNRRTTGFTEAIFEFGYQGIRRGDLVIHAMDAFAGAVGVSDSDGKGSPVYAVCEARKGAQSAYYAHVVREMARSQWIVALSKGIRQRSTDFRFDVFAVQKVPFPPPEEQTAIVCFLEHANRRIDQFIRSKRKLIALLNEQKRAIIHRAVTRGLDPNVKLKHSGVPWLGELPANWEIRRIRQVAVVGRGKFTHRPRNDPSLYGGKYPFIQTGAVARAQRVVESYSQTLNERGLAASKMFPAGTLLMTIAANIGDVAILGFDACFPDSIVAFSPRPGVDRDFLYAVFRTMKSEFMREAPVSTQGNLNIDRVSMMAVPVPPLNEQRAIAEFVVSSGRPIDAVIKQANDEMSLMREYRARLISDVVTGQLDVRTAAARLPAFEPATTPTEFEDDEDPDIEDGEAP